MPSAQAQLMNGTDLARALIDDTARANLCS